MSIDATIPAESRTTPCFRRFWLVVYAIVFTFVALLTVETALRVRFPWDFYFWPESPFLTDMMKLDHHQPVYTDPADGNSFVYSPGLEYICYAILKPLGLELDIRYCRLINVILGVLAAGFGALAAVRPIRSFNSIGKDKLFLLATWSLIWLVLSKNFLADIVHPDNLHIFHAALVFLLTCLAVETRRFGFALAATLVAGVGVFTKQTEALSLAGPLLAFAVFNPWGWRRWLLLAAIGTTLLAVSVYVLWLPTWAKFWTLDLLRQQPIILSKSLNLSSDLLSKDRGVLFCLAVISLPVLWKSNPATRRYLVCWALVGIFAVLPNVLAYLKTMGAWNNLVIFEIWLTLLVWPFAQLISVQVSASVPVNGPALRSSILVLFFIFVLLLVPMKAPPRSADYTFGRDFENAVHADLKAGKKTLVSCTSEVLIRSGATSPPVDRGNSLVELCAAGLDSKSTMLERINSRYYDRIYLVSAAFYGTNLLAAIDRNYTVSYTFPKGIWGNQCEVLSPRAEK